MENSTICSLLILIVMLNSGCSQFSGGKLNSNCKQLHDLIDMVFSGEDADLKYMLYTRSNPKNACNLQPTGRALKKCKFNPDVGTKVLIHGWIQHLLADALEYELKDKLLQFHDCNVVILNWTAYSNTYNTTESESIDFVVAALHTFYVGFKLSTWIHFLQDHRGANSEKFHLIGHSLGAEVAAFAGKTTCNLGRNTYLDAAEPFFEYIPEFLQPSSEDAIFVEAIHTSNYANPNIGYGFARPIADIDYYPNGGDIQPNCFPGSQFQSDAGQYETVDSESTLRTCYHDSSLQFYIESVNKNCKFLGRICDTYEEYASCKCSSENAPHCRMGFYSTRKLNLPVHSKCYLETSINPPFCLN